MPEIIETDEHVLNDPERRHGLWKEDRLMCGMVASTPRCRGIVERMGQVWHCADYEIRCPLQRVGRGRGDHA